MQVLMVRYTFRAIHKMYIEMAFPRHIHLFCFHFISDPQEELENQPGISDLEKFYSSYRVPQYFNLDDENPMQRLQYQYRFGRRAPPALGTRAEDFNLLPAMRQYRTMMSMMTKRVPSPRYRQCYFNPVACFRK